MSIGQALDYMAEYVANKTKEQGDQTSDTNVSRQATQADFNAF